MTKAKESTTSKRASTRESRGKPTKPAPKRTLSAYMLFSQERRAKVKADNPDASFGKIGQLLGEMWRNLSADEKKVYQDKAEEEKKKPTAASSKN
ncbi:Non-histone chromosomal protein 6 [Apophysomyces ossiformis]|uniref:Non-histone chromosomal protein 6 n=1 Tax=Apophysomyces ossiformis TaxID=679940 RepID=A0A8H7BXL3_9FUNG|nr:Non-histone chromosomal protein 6 [Apophysomyces ossiformis]